MCPFVLSKRTTFFPPRRGPWAVHAVTCRLPACRVAAPLLGLVLPVPDVGLTECNKAVFGLLRGALAGQGRAALDRMASAERATSMLINQLGIRLYC